MKTIYVILPVYNNKMLNKNDLIPFQSEEYRFLLHYPATNLKELSTIDDVEVVVPLVLKKVKEAIQNNVAAIVINAFGDVGLNEARKLTQNKIPVISAGRVAIRKAYSISKKFTVIPVELEHNHFIESMINDERLHDKFVLMQNAINMNPAELATNRQKRSVINKLVAIIEKEIEKSNVDTFTFGCCSLFGIADSLQLELRKITGNCNINIIDPTMIALLQAKKACI